MSSPAIVVENLGKKYKIGLRAKANRTFPEALTDAMKAPFRRLRALRENSNLADTIWALKDVSFEVQPGEVVGIIGRNGAGKSTLLKILSRITEPTIGRAIIHGRVRSLLEVGTGFHPELTGRENIYLNGAILGMKKSEINRKFDEIVAFAEIEKFLDTPVKRYSSGMYVRLAFAVAAHLDPEILIIDEVLAVGDAEFQKKCLGKMRDVAVGGRTILFVSHNMGAVASLCGTAIHLANGGIQATGRTDRIVSEYMAEVHSNKIDDIEQLRLAGMGKTVKFADISLVSEKGSSFKFGDPITFALRVTSNADMKDLSIGFSVFSLSGVVIGTLFTRQTFSVKTGQELLLQLKLSDSCLAPGSYYPGFGIGWGGTTSRRDDQDIVIGKPSFHVLPVSVNDNHICEWNPTWGNIVFLNTELTIQG